MTDPTPPNAAQSQLEAILKNAVDAIITIDQRGIVVDVNPATEKLFGYPPDEVLGQNIKMLMPSPYREEHDDYLANYRKTGQAEIIGIGREVTGRRKDGVTFPMHLAVSEVTTDDRRLFTGIVRDISDLKRAEHELTKLNEQLEARVEERTLQLQAAQEELVRKEKLATLGQVSGGIAHEIRNPLNAVKSSAYFLLNARQLTPEKMAEHLQRIDRQVTTIDNVITALTDIARMPSPVCQPTAVPAMLRESISSVDVPESIEVVFELSADLPHVLVDETQITIIFRNLIRNARDAMEAGGTLTIRGHADGDRVEVHVGDTGVGISEENLSKVTEPLFSTKARGMGLGLAISKAIAEKNACTLQIASRLGQGSTFSLVMRAVLDESVEQAS